MIGQSEEMELNHYLTAMQTMTDLFKIRQISLESFNRKQYAPAFEEFYQKVLPAFDSIEELYKTVAEPQEMLGNMAREAVGQVKTDLDGLKKKRQKDQAMISYNLQLAVFVYPAILQYNGESSRPFLETFSRQWKEAFPATNVQAASFEEIQNGFHRKFCYISTAVCRETGRPDDCYELELLRSYRDGYLSERPDGDELIKRYYDLAPSIVKHISQHKDASQIYQGIWEQYLEPCIRLIENEQNEECCELYETMVEDLKEKYFQ